MLKNIKLFEDYQVQWFNKTYTQFPQFLCINYVYVKFNWYKNFLIC